MTENKLSYKIIGIALELHRHLGPGLLESAYEFAYEFALAHELRNSGLFVEQQVPMPFIYKEIKLECGYRIDLRVESKLLIEIKAIETLAPVHHAQTLTYLKLSGCNLVC